MRRLVARADRRLPARRLAGAAAALQVRADLLGLRGPGDSRLRHTAGAGAGGVAGAALQPVQPRRLRSRGGPAPVPPPRHRADEHPPDRQPRPAADRRVRSTCSCSSTTRSGSRWGFSIIALTIVVRAALIPLTLKQFKSMQALQRLSPEIKALQAKYKDDTSAPEPGDDEVLPGEQGQPVRARACPLVLQLPVFFSLFYMLRKDLKLDICPGIVKYAAAARDDRHERRVQPGRSREREVPLHPRPDRQGHGRRAGGPARPLRRLATALERAHVGPPPTKPALHHDRAAVRVRRPSSRASRPACSCTGSPRTCGPC